MIKATYSISNSFFVLVFYPSSLLFSPLLSFLSSLLFFSLRFSIYSALRFCLLVCIPYFNSPMTNFRSIL
jgi:hypothetical protein